jgi:hypothetical protein
VNINREIGRIGANRWGGVYNEEFLRELRGRKGVEVYKEMTGNDGVVGAILFAVEMLMRQADWSVEPAKNTAADEDAADFVFGCLHDMQDTWTDTLSEILSFLTFGWSAHELVYKRRMGKRKDARMHSKFSDGLIGWRKIPIRSQETLYQWVYDDSDNLLGMVQMPPPNYGLIQIPAERLLLFRTRSRKGNPEGQSIFRTAYRSFYFKRRIQEIEGIGIERDLAGFPVMVPAEGIDIWNDDDPDMREMYLNAEQIVKNIKRDSQEGIVLPFGWDLKLLSTGSRRQFDTNVTIQRYDLEIATSVISDFVFLGHEHTGSYALSSDKTKLFSMAIGAYLKIICDVFNSKAIPALIDLNTPRFNGITDYPKLVHGDIESPDIAKLSMFVRDLTAVGALIPDASLEEHLREVAGLPERDPETEYTTSLSMAAEQAAYDRENGNKEDEDGDHENSDRGSRAPKTSQLSG